MAKNGRNRKFDPKQTSEKVSSQAGYVLNVIGMLVRSGIPVPAWLKLLGTFAGSSLFQSRPRLLGSKKGLGLKSRKRPRLLGSKKSLYPKSTRRSRSWRFRRRLG